MLNGDSYLQVQELKFEMKKSRMPWPGDEGEQRWEQAWMAIKKVLHSCCRSISLLFSFPPSSVTLLLLLPLKRCLLSYAHVISSNNLLVELVRLEQQF